MYVQVQIPIPEELKSDDYELERWIDQVCDDLEASKEWGGYWDLSEAQVDGGFLSADGSKYCLEIRLDRK